MRGCSLKNDTIISVCFQDKPFSVTVIQVYAQTTKAEEAEVEWFYEDLQDLLELTEKKDTTHPIAKEKPQQDSRRGEIMFKIKPHSLQRCLEGSNKTCEH